MAKKAHTVTARTLTAYHEAGHAVLSATMHGAPERISIRPIDETFGRSDLRVVPSPSVRAQIHVAGFAAEHLLTGRRSRELDREIRFSIVARTDGALADAFPSARTSDGWRAVEEVLRTGVPERDDVIRSEVDRHYDAACGSLAAAWPAVKAVACALLDCGELDRNAFERVMAGVDAGVVARDAKKKP